MTAKDLKNALLQEAVQGKLVPQIASEGNARDLLEEIRKSHTDLQIPTESAEKKKGDLRSKSQIRVTKKTNVLPEITEDEIPFDIPDNWCWCRLEDIVELKSGNQYEESASGTLYLKVADMNLPENAYEIVTSSRYTNCSDDSFIPKNSIIFPKRGGAISTNKKKLILKEKVFIDSNTMGMIPKKNELLPYLYSWFDFIDLGKLSTGTSVPQINNKDLYPLYFPLPPLAEQKRIVAAIEKFMPLIEEYGKKETVLKELNAQIGTLTKKAILQEAVQGKLVPQIASEGNARDLLEQIKAQKAALIKEGKIKKEKPLAEITEDEIPFDIPENWCWCRLGDVTSFNGGYAFKSEKYTSNGIRVLRISDFNETGIVNKSPVYYPKTLDLECYKIQDNDIVMCMTGGTVGKTYHFKKLEEEYYVNQRVADLKCSNLINDDYVYLVIQNSYIKRKIDECKNSTNDNISADLIKSFVIPFPPLSEQKRIVAAIEQLLPLCEKLGR